MTSRLEQPRPILSVGQALLLLIEAHWDNPVYSQNLKKLYFLGVTDYTNDLDANMILLRQCLQDPVLRHYDIPIPTDPLLINEDPTRRYFETQFAFELIKTTIKEISLESLQTHFAFLHRVIPEEYARDRDVFLQRIQRTFSIDAANFEGSYNEYEYHNALKKLASESCYTDFPQEDKDKMALIFQCTYISVSQKSKSLKSEPPMNHLYWQGFFHEEVRGQNPKNCDDQKAVKSLYWGLMKSYMHVPYDDVALAKYLSLDVRPVDKMNFHGQSEWAIDNFNRLVHPFVCSLSGTLLYFMCWILLAHERHELAFNDTSKMRSFFRAYIPAMMFHLGGHSFHEYLYPLTIPEIQAHFGFIDGFDTFTMENLFFTGNEDAFTVALHKTFPYLHKMLQHKQAMHELTSPLRFFPKRRIQVDICEAAMLANTKQRFMEDQENSVAVSAFS